MWWLLAVPAAIVGVICVEAVAFAAVFKANQEDEREFEREIFGD